MNRFFKGAGLCALAGLLFLAGCLGGGRWKEDAGYQNGTWEGTGRGYRGEIRVHVQVAASLIQGIEIGTHDEDPFTGGEAMEELLGLVLEYQTTDLDAISGATESSAGFLEAVEDALRNSNPSQVGF
ncbi:MAG: FMN-binding protein [Treponema sp.]|jgi:fumarate reductase flavoprotein subunit|nr:FMN-binding protein [Treponema sp.]